jgi:inosose dehydratase
MVFSPGSYRDQAGRDTEPRQLDADSWTTLTRSATEIGKIVSQDYGLQLVYHPHADTHVQTQPEIERFLDGTDPRYVSLCLDTGHVAYGGGDNVALIRQYSDRIGYVHIKQMDPEIVATAWAEDLSFGEAVRRGVAVEPPNGVPDVASITDALTDLEAELFVIVEQDLYPCPPDVPLPIATRTNKYLRAFGLGSAG